MVVYFKLPILWVQSSTFSACSKHSKMLIYYVYGNRILCFHLVFQWYHGSVHYFYMNVAKLHLEKWYLITSMWSVNFIIDAFWECPLMYTSFYKEGWISSYLNSLFWLTETYSFKRKIFVDRLALFHMNINWKCGFL